MLASHFGTAIFYVLCLYFHSKKLKAKSWVVGFKIRIHTKEKLLHSNPFIYPRGTVVWNDYLLIYLTKCHILLHKKLKTPCKYWNVMNYQGFSPFLNFKSFLLKVYWFWAVYWWFLQIQICARTVTKWGRYSYSKLLIMPKYRLCCLICAESVK